VVSWGGVWGGGVGGGWGGGVGGGWSVERIRSRQPRSYQWDFVTSGGMLQDRLGRSPKNSTAEHDFVECQMATCCPMPKTDERSKLVGDKVA